MILKRLPLPFGLVAAFVSPGVAFDTREAETVVVILEELALERGQAIHAGAAAEWYAYDAEGTGLIAAAGFTEARWTSAYHAVVAGLVAATPQAEFDAMFAEPLARLAASSLAEEQKSAIRVKYAAQVVEARSIRAAGAAHAAAVAPLLTRLQALTYGPAD
ncbi:hypothetical protein [Devosia geojensis]|uniref:hypothetical protein n=1 Tax=Devosia geojensis TaxID=443610 RepID=UPI00128AF506|nr:hypothetical protein [Devosia geojensis]